jgi:hypothetical protein
MLGSIPIWSFNLNISDRVYLFKDSEIIAKKPDQVIMPNPHYKIHALGSTESTQNRLTFPQTITDSV